MGVGVMGAMKQIAINLDSCEMCGETAVCYPFTAETEQSGETAVVTDMLICDRCKTGVTLRRMRQLEHVKVMQLRGLFNV